MWSKLCQSAPLGVLLLSVSLAAGGCFLAHGDAPLPAPDAGRPAPDAGPLPSRPTEDAGPPLTVDAAVSDSSVPVECDGPSSPRRPDRTTVSLGGFGGMALPSDEEFDLPVSVDDGCYCGESLVCDVSVRRGEGLSPTVIELNSAFCSEGFLCDGCFPHLDGVCHVPALPAGDYRVRMNGEEAFLLTLPTWRSDTQEQISFTPAPPVPDSLICPWESTTVRDVSQLCAPAQVIADTSALIKVTMGCGSCFDAPADCNIIQEGERLIVDARTRSCDCPACGACAAVCVPVDVSCRLPPLPVGTYTLEANGVPLSFDVVPGFPGGELPPAPDRCVAIDVAL